MKYLLLVGVLVSGNCLADNIVINTVSTHYNIDGLNEFNPGIGYEKANYTAGMFLNSYERTSIYAGFKFESTGPVKLGVIVGGVTGYKKEELNTIFAGNVALIAAPYLQYKMIRLTQLGAATAIQFVIEI